METSFWNILVALSVTAWIGFARIARSQTLSIRESDFVKAAILMGADRNRIILKHIIPNILAPLSVELNTKNLNIKINDLNNNVHSGGTAINVGNPHVVFFVDEIENYDIRKIGPQIENHKIFPEKCNVTLAKVINKNLIKVKVWERGAGLTKACGTAACATAFAGKLNDLTENKTDIEFKTGKLTIFIDDKNSIHMKGPVSNIQEISIKL